MYSRQSGNVLTSVLNACVLISCSLLLLMIASSLYAHYSLSVESRTAVYSRFLGLQQIKMQRAASDVLNKTDFVEFPRPVDLGPVAMVTSEGKK